MLIPWQQAKRLLVVDPSTGLQVEHVKACDPQTGLLEVWATYEAAPGHSSIWLKDGRPEERPYMLLQMTDMYDGSRSWMTRFLAQDFDVIDKYSGEVLYEYRRATVDSCIEDADLPPL